MSIFDVLPTWVNTFGFGPCRQASTEISPFNYGMDEYRICQLDEAQAQPYLLFDFIHANNVDANYFLYVCSHVLLFIHFKFMCYLQLQLTASSFLFLVQIVYFQSLLMKIRSE